MVYVLEGDVISYIRQNLDGTRDQVYVKAVRNNTNHCRGCYLYNREIMSVKKPICDKCYAAWKDCGQPIKFEFDHIKYQ